MGRITVRATPRAGRNGIASVSDDDVVHVRVTAAPTAGEANAAVARLLADALGLPRRDVTLEHGATGRTKHFVVPGDTADLLARLREVAAGIRDR